MPRKLLTSPQRLRLALRRLRLPLLLALALTGTVQAQSTWGGSSYDAPATDILRTAGVNPRTDLPLIGHGLSLEELPPLPNLPGTIDLTMPTDDLWVRIRNGFSMPDLQNSLVLSHQQRYMNQAEYLRRMVERSSKYMYYIVSELEKRGMPTEIALLPMVESSFNPMAHSPAAASGLWQFIPSTGRNYNLNQDFWVDERRDVVASTNAALDYLQNIYQMHGDWHLALASYNWGENAVGRAVRKNEAQGRPTDFNSLTMPNETRNYVPKLQALKNIFGSPQLMARLQLPSLPNRPYFETVTQNEPIDVKTAAKLAGMTQEEFVSLNPSHNRPVIKGNSRLVLPAEKVGTYMSNLEKHEGPLSSWKLYAPKPGERLDNIAPKYGVTAADLRRINGATGRLSMGTGEVLVPNSAEIGTLSEPLTAAPAIPAAPVVRVMTKAAPPPAPPVAKHKAPAVDIEHHVVKKGETLASLAKRYDVSVADLKRENHLKGELKSGTRLTITTEREERRGSKQAERSNDKRKGKLSRRDDDDDDEDECTGRRCKQTKAGKSAKAEKARGKASRRDDDDDDDDCRGRRCKPQKGKAAKAGKSGKADRDDDRHHSKKGKAEAKGSGKKHR